MFIQVSGADTEYVDLLLSFHTPHYQSPNTWTVFLTCLFIFYMGSHHAARVGLEFRSPCLSLLGLQGYATIPGYLLCIDPMFSLFPSPPCQTDSCEVMAGSLNFTLPLALSDFLLSLR